MPEEPKKSLKATQPQKPPKGAPEKAPAEAPEEIPGEKPKKKAPVIGVGGDFFSPAALMLFIIAGLLDIVGLALVCIALDDLGILDIIGLIFVGGLMYLHSGQITVTKGVKKLRNKLLKRVGLSFLGEIIPYFGGFAPCWTIAVFFHLRDS